MRNRARAPRDLENRTSCRTNHTRCILMPSPPKTPSRNGCTNLHSKNREAAPGESACSNHRRPDRLQFPDDPLLELSNRLVEASSSRPETPSKIGTDMPLPLYGSSRGPCRHSPGSHPRPGRRRFRGRGLLTRTTPREQPGQLRSRTRILATCESSSRVVDPPRCTQDAINATPPTVLSCDQPRAGDGIGSLRISCRERPPRVTSPISASLHATSAPACADNNSPYRMSDHAPVRRVSAPRLFR